MQTSHNLPTKTRGARLEARVSTEQKALFQQAAMLSACTLSEFVVASAQEAAARIIKSHETIALTRDEQCRFVTALLTPPAASDNLRQAAAQYRAQRGV